MSTFKIRNKQDKKRPKPHIKATITAAMARAALFSPMAAHQRFCAELDEARKVGKGRDYRGHSADHESDTSARFAGIYNRGCYQARRGR